MRKFETESAQMSWIVNFVSICGAQLAFVAVVLSVFAMCTYTVTETERALVLEWNEPVGEVVKPGIHFKLPPPFQTIVFLPKPYYMWDASPRSMITADKKALLVDDFVVVHITDGIKFYQQLKTMQNALTRVDAVSYDAIRSELGKHNLEAIIDKDRNQIMVNITKETNEGIKGFGMEAALVRITRADLPPENKKSVHLRMNAERKQISDGYRAEGNEQNTNKKAQTDQEVMTIVAEGEKKAQITMGEGDAEATRIYNSAYGKDPKFFRFYRALETARLSLTNGGKIQIIENGNEPHLRELFDR